MSQEAKSLYDTLKAQGALGPGWTGKWVKDKTRFIEQYNADEEFINGTGEIFEDDQFDEWS